MKRIVCAVMVVVWLGTIVGGCSQGDKAIENSRPDAKSAVISTDAPKALANLDFAEGKVIVLSRSFAETSRKMTLTADVDYQGIPKGRYGIVISPYLGEQGEIGATFSLVNQSSVALFEYVMYWDADSVNYVTFVERTPSDQMVVTRSLIGDVIHESYDINSTSHAFAYNQAILEVLRGQLQYSEFPDSVVSQANQLQSEFATFYRLDNSLNGNKAGELLIQLITNDTVRGLVMLQTGQMHQGPDLRKVAVSTLVKVGVVAAICAKLKCLPILGGLANPLCVPCLGVEAAVIIAELVLWISGDEE